MAEHAVTKAEMSAAAADTSRVFLPLIIFPWVALLYTLVIAGLLSVIGNRRERFKVKKGRK